MREQRICALADIANPGAREFALPELERSLFVVRKDDAVRAYLNSCPHTGAPLNWQPDQFLDGAGEYIQCSLHMAVFDIASGECLAGPCVRQHLPALEIAVRAGDIYLLTASAELP